MVAAGSAFPCIHVKISSKVMEKFRRLSHYQRIDVVHQAFVDGLGLDVVDIESMGLSNCVMIHVTHEQAMRGGDVVEADFLRAIDDLCVYARLNTLCYNREVDMKYIARDACLSISGVNPLTTASDIASWFDEHVMRVAPRSMRERLEDGWNLKITHTEIIHKIHRANVTNNVYVHLSPSSLAWCVRNDDTVRCMRFLGWPIIRVRMRRDPLRYHTRTLDGKSFTHGSAHIKRLRGPAVEPPALGGAQGTGIADYR